MKKLMNIFFVLLCAGSVNAQVNKKDTVQVDSSHIEKIKKMPMDTVHNKMPTKPVLPEEQKNKKDEDPIKPIHKKE